MSRETVTRLLWTMGLFAFVIGMIYGAIKMFSILT